MLRMHVYVVHVILTHFIYPQVDEQMLNVQNKNSSYFVASCLPRSEVLPLIMPCLFG